MQPTPRMPPPSTREKILARIRGRLLRRGYPRLQMLLIVSLTSLAGFLIASLLLRAGLASMALRYLLACAAAYLVFLLLIGLWLRTRSQDYEDIPDIGGDGSTDRAACGQGDHPAGSGYDAVAEPHDAADAEGTDMVADAFGSATSAEEFAIPALALLVAAIALLASLFLIWSAPALLAEVLLDGALAAGLYRRLRRDEHRHWLESAVRRTWLPFLATAVFAACAGWSIQYLAPGARSVGDLVVPGAVGEVE